MVSMISKLYTAHVQNHKKNPFAHVLGSAFGFGVYVKALIGFKAF